MLAKVSANRMVGERVARYWQRRALDGLNSFENSLRLGWAIHGR